jgi:hypothetical protein
VNDEHRAGDLFVYVLLQQQCQVVESDNIAFSQEAGNNPSKSNDALTDMYYYLFKGVWRYSIQCGLPVEWQ